MFIKTNDILNEDGSAIAETNRAHEYLRGEVFGLGYERNADKVTAAFSGGYYSSSTGKTHYGNFHKWAICGTPSPIHYIRGKEVTCKNCQRLFKRAVPLTIRYSRTNTQSIPIIATNKARVKYSQRGFFERVKSQAYRKNNGKWSVSRLHEGRKETFYKGEPLRVILSPSSRSRELAPMITYYIPDSHKDIGLTCVSFEQEVSVKGRPLIIPSSLCYVAIRSSSRWVTMPLDSRAVRHTRNLTNNQGKKYLKTLLSDWVLYKSYQETIRMILTGSLKPLRCCEG